MITMTQDSKRASKAKTTISGVKVKNNCDDSTMDDNPAIYRMYKITLDNNADDMESYFYKFDEKSKTLKSFFKIGKPLFEYSS